MELNLKNLAPLLQCTSINRCTLFITSKRKKYYFIKFLSPLLLKKYFFLFLSLSLSGFSSIFLFLPLPVLHFNQTGLSTQSVAPKLSADHSSLPSADRSPAQRRPLLTTQRRPKSSQSVAPKLSADHFSLPSADRSPAQRRPLFAFSTSKAEPPSSTLSLLPHAQRRCGFLFVFSDLLWASGLVFVFVAVGLCLLWVFFFFLLWTAGSGGGGGGGGGGCACG